MTEEKREQDQALKRIVKWVTLIGMMGLAAFGFGFVMFQTISPTDPNSSWIVAVIQQHYAATLGVPMSAVAALCIVLLLEQAAGPIEFEAPWFKFRGASGPVILWIFVFLAMIIGLNVLWGPTGS